MTANQLAPIFSGALPAHLTTHESSMAAEAMSSRPKISTQGGVFRRVIGDVKTDPAMSIQVIVLRAGPAGANKTNRTYYEGAFDATKASSPVCWSPDGEAPSPKSKTPQCTTCALCPKNIKGSGANGSKACRYSKNLAVVFPDDLDTVYRLSVPASSLFADEHVQSGTYGWRSYVSRCIAGRIPVEGLITELSFPLGSTEGFRLRPASYVDQSVFPHIVELTKSQEVIDIVTMDINEVSDGESAEAHAFAPAGVPPVAPPVAPPAQAEHDVTQEIPQGFAPTPVYATQPAPVAPPVAPPAPVAPPPAQVVPVAEISDAAQARVDSLLAAL